jgi:acyl-CoA thioester hydrolase
MQHVNNVVYLEYMQDARVGLIEAMGISRVTLNEVGHFVARNEIDYILPIPMDITHITVRVWIEKIGGASYNVAYEFVDAAGTVYAKAKTVMVTVDVATGTVIRVPDNARELLSGFMAE